MKNLILRQKNLNLVILNLIFFKSFSQLLECNFDDSNSFQEKNAPTNHPNSFQKTFIEQFNASYEGTIILYNVFNAILGH